MRNENEVINEILSFAKENELVRAVILNGSRTNPNAPKDIFQDYDVVFGVTDTEYFFNNRQWIKKFGDLIIMQQNDLVEDELKWHIFLMIFTDGVRIDLQFFPIDKIELKYKDSLKILLLDKDNKIGSFQPADDSFYIIKRPSKNEYDKVLNNFWWCSTYVAKGIKRDELTYSKYMFDSVIREEILKLTSWYIGMNHNWQVNPGKLGKWTKKFVSDEIWNSIEKTYSGMSYDEMWEALFEACSLVHKIGIAVGESLGYSYPVEDDIRVTEYLKKVKDISCNSIVI